MVNKRVVTHVAITSQQKITNANIIRYAITAILNVRDARVTSLIAVQLMWTGLPAWWCVFNSVFICHHSLSFIFMLPLHLQITAIHFAHCSFWLADFGFCSFPSLIISCVWCVCRKMNWKIDAIIM